MATSARTVLLVDGLAVVTLLITTFAPVERQAAYNIVLKLPRVNGC